MNHAEVLARLGRAYPRQQIPAETFQVYLEELADVPAIVLAVAVTHLIRTSEWFPTIRAIRETCAELTLSLPSETQALAAVDLFLRDPEENPPHPLVREAAKLAGGFREFRVSTEPGVVRGQFSRYYRELRTAAIRGAQTADARPETAPRLGIGG